MGVKTSEKIIWNIICRFLSLSSISHQIFISYQLYSRHHGVEVETSDKLLYSYMRKHNTYNTY